MKAHHAIFCRTVTPVVRTITCYWPYEVPRIKKLRLILINEKSKAFSFKMKSLIKLTFQNSDIVVILESGDLTMDMSLETRFCYQAPIIKQYADAIAKECPNSFIIVCASPIDCMVPLIAEVSLFIVYNSIIS